MGKPKKRTRTLLYWSPWLHSYTHGFFRMHVHWLHILGLCFRPTGRDGFNGDGNTLQDLETYFGAFLSVANVFDIRRNWVYFNLYAKRVRHNCVHYVRICNNSGISTTLGCVLLDMSNVSHKLYIYTFWCVYFRLQTCPYWNTLGCV